MKFLVLGGGAMGSAAAFDLCRRDGVAEVRIADLHVDHVAPFLDAFTGGKLSLHSVNATEEESVAAVMHGMDAVLNALPYYLNPLITRLAVQAGCHYSDLGGNTEIVERQRTLNEQAVAKRLSVIPDCGVAPGMVNILAQAGIDQMEEPESVRIWVGGLPQHPKPPLNYQIVYSIEGMLDYYTTPALILQGGELTEVEALDGMETVTFPDPVGELEAFYTAGGISTLPFRYQGAIREMTYKTLRYPGHADIMRAIRELGLLSLDPVSVNGTAVVPRKAFIASATPKLTNPAGDDLVALRVQVSGRNAGKPTTVRYDLVDYYDTEHGVTAMMRTTGYSLAITALMQADGRVTKLGVRTPDEAVPAEEYIAELARSGVRVKRSG